MSEFAWRSLGSRYSQDLEEDEQGADGAADAKDGEAEADTEKKKQAVKDAVEVLVAAAVQSGASKAVKDEIDKDRAGIAMWRIP